MSRNHEIDKKQAWDEFRSYVLMRDSRQFEAFSKYQALQNKDVEVVYNTQDELEM